jgi:hypothetical protein
MAERHDWALFRSIEGLQQKAGVPADKLRRLVLKELADNALDEATSCRSGFDKDRDVLLRRRRGPRPRWHAARDCLAVQHPAVDAVEQAAARQGEEAGGLH